MIHDVSLSSQLTLSMVAELKRNWVTLCEHQGLQRNEFQFAFILVVINFIVVHKKDLSLLSLMSCLVVGGWKSGIFKNSINNLIQPAHAPTSGS